MTSAPDAPPLAAPEPARTARPGTELRADWNAANLAALTAACIAAAAVLAVRNVQRSRPAGESVAVDASRAAAGTDLINPNTAPVASLRRLPGIGPTKAKAIVAWREAHGGRPFRDANDLLHVPGIGPGIRKRLVDTKWLVFGK